MLEILSKPWPWYAAGILIGLTVPALLILGNKSFGISSSLRHICAACIPANIPFFKYDWKKESWNLFFVTGIFLGGVVASQLLSNPEPIKIAEQTRNTLAGYGITHFDGLMPSDLFSPSNIFSLKGLIFFVTGGIMIGFGTRWAGGCTSGHAIMGLANLQLPSLIATCCFMIGGFITTWVILPFLFKFIL